MRRLTRTATIDVAQIRLKTCSGFPLTLDEQRWLVELITGSLPLTKKRCYLCHETGRTRIPIADGYSDQGDYLEIICTDCGGAGRRDEYIVWRVLNAQLLVDAYDQRRFDV